MRKKEIDNKLREIKGKYQSISCASYQQQLLYKSDCGKDHAAACHFHLVHVLSSSENSNSFLLLCGITSNPNYVIFLSCGQCFQIAVKCGIIDHSAIRSFVMFLQLLTLHHIGSWYCTIFLTFFHIFYACFSLACVLFSIFGC